MRARWRRAMRCVDIIIASSQTGLPQHCENTGRLGKRIGGRMMTLPAMLEGHLLQELGDAPVARELADVVLHETLCWRAPVMAAERITTIFGFTFGNRMLPNGNREPGPVNEALADIVATLHARTGARVFAQWEVAHSLGARVPHDLVTSINPDAICAASRCISALRACSRRSRGRHRRNRSVVSAWWRSPIICIAAWRRRDGWVSTRTRRRRSRCRTTYDAQSGQAWCRDPARLSAARHDGAAHRAPRRRCRRWLGVRVSRRFQG